MMMCDSNLVKLDETHCKTVVDFYVLATSSPNKPIFQQSFRKKLRIYSC